MINKILNIFYEPSCEMLAEIRKYFGRTVLKLSVEIKPSCAVQLLFF